MKRLTILCLIALVAAACRSKPPPPPPVSAPPPKAKPSQLKTVYFDFDESAIRSDQAANIENNAAVMKSHERLRLTIEGHCDERGTNEYNMALGDRRARATKNYLINLGIDPGRTETVSYGEERGVCSESNESCWWQNRRAEFVK